MHAMGRCALTAAAVSMIIYQRVSGASKPKGSCSIFWFISSLVGWSRRVKPVFRKSNTPQEV
eukprot:962043-Amphidinium_carterae.1